MTFDIYDLPSYVLNQAIDLNLETKNNENNFYQLIKILKEEFISNEIKSFGKFEED